MDLNPFEPLCSLSETSDDVIVRAPPSKRIKLSTVHVVTAPLAALKPRVLQPLVDSSPTVAVMPMRRPVPGAQSVLLYMRSLRMKDDCKLAQLMPSITAKCVSSKPLVLDASLRTSVNLSYFVTYLKST